MSRRQWVLLLLLAAAAAIVTGLALHTRQPPLLPADAEHASFDGAERCLTCHGPEGVSPRSKNHPNGFDCTRCHGAR